MTGSKHTPGPWWTEAKYDGRERGCCILAARTDAGALPGNPTRGQVAFATELLNTNARRCEANARLIAAAPDLLEAMRNLLAAPYETNALCGGEKYITASSAARAAIAKATVP